MKKLLIGLLVASGCLSGALAQDPVPHLVNYQGRLTDGSGTALSTGTYGVLFQLYDTPAAATNLIWGATYKLVTVGGQFNVVLGAAGGTGVTNAAVNDIGYAFGAQGRYLQMTILTDNTGTNLLVVPQVLAPRQQILSAPYALSALTASNAVNAANGSPPGTVSAYMGTNAPTGWLLCDGSAISRINYAALFAVIGTASGQGDGSATFNLPDMRGVFLRGVNGARSDSYADPDDNTLRTNIFAGGNTGNAVGSYQADMFASHNHTIGIGSDGTVIAGNILQGTSGVTFRFSSSGINGDFNGADGSHYAGGSETRPKNTYVNYIIKY
jgi:tail collar domain